jgi:hypothetical protein
MNWRIGLGFIGIRSPLQLDWERYAIDKAG